MDILIQEMSVQDYDDVRDLWQSAEGIVVRGIDSRESIIRFLERNPGLSFVAYDEGKLVGAVLCSHDGRRGYIDQLAVLESHRRQGIGRSLVSRCLFHLMRNGIRRWNLFVFENNEDAIAFWRKLGWSQRVELVTMTSTG